MMTVMVLAVTSGSSRDTVTSYSLQFSRRLRHNQAKRKNKYRTRTSVTMGTVGTPGVGKEAWREKLGGSKMALSFSSGLLASLVRC